MLENNGPLQFRSMSAADGAFLFALFTAVRGSNFNSLPLPDKAKQVMIKGQFDAQAAQYKTQFPEAQQLIIQYDGVDCGQTMFELRPKVFTWIDLSILPEFQNKGIGSGVTAAAINQGRQRNIPVTLHVEETNARAKFVYERLGFVPEGSDGIYMSMIWTPSTR